MWLDYFLKVYWRTLFILTYPLLALSVFAYSTDQNIKCSYVVLVIIGFWVTEAIPTAVTGFIPMILFPLMTIMDSPNTSRCYLTDTNMLFLAGLMIAVAIENCGLHKRIALNVIFCIGCSVRKISFALMIITMFISMWIANTATVAMMCSVVDAILSEMENGGLQVYKNRDEVDPETGDNIPDEELKPANVTKCLYIGIAYAASIGGMGSLVGTGTNVAFVGIMAQTYDGSQKELTFLKWIGLCLPIIILATLSVWFFLQLFYLGLFRRNSQSAQLVSFSSEQKESIKEAVRNDITKLGPLSFKEINMLILFLLVVCLWLFREPHIFEGWANRLAPTKERAGSGTMISDASTGLFVVILTFVVPASTDFIHIFSKDVESRPKKSGPALCTWTLIHTKVPWGIILLIGSSFAIAKASKISGMSTMVGHWFDSLNSLNPILLVCLSSMFVCFLTQLFCNIIVCNIFIPVLIEMAIGAHLNPIYICLPAALSCSLAFTLPASTPPNAMVQAKGHLSVFDFLKCGICVTIICYIITVGMTIGYGRVFYDFDKVPNWALSPNKTEELYFVE